MCVGAAEQLGDESFQTDSSQFMLDLVSFLWLVPEEKHALSQLFLRGFCTSHGLECVGVISGVPHLCADGHGSWGEILHLFQLEVQTFGDESQVGHVRLAASRMAADEIRDDLLSQAFFLVDVVEDPLE